MKITESNYIKDSVSKMGLSYPDPISFDQNLEDSIGYPDKLLESDFMKDLEKIVKKWLNLS